MNDVIVREYKGKARLVEVMCIVNLPPCNLNRDENGQPKEGRFAGVPRNYLSASSQKKPLRETEQFKNLFKDISKSVRTANIHEYVYDYIGSDSLSSEMKLAIKTLCNTLNTKKATASECLIKYDKANDTYILPSAKGSAKSKESLDTKGKKKDDTDTSRIILVYTKEQVKYVQETIKMMVDLCDGDVDTFSLFKNTNIFERSIFGSVAAVSLDTACFGSTSMTDSIRSIPAAISVSKALSVNEAVCEYDFYVATDDFVTEHPERAQGAANMGYTSFTSPCFYKYIAIDVDILKENLYTVTNKEEIVSKLIARIVYDFSNILPSGSQTNNAAFSMPSSVCVVLKDKKIPCNHSNAFEVPIERQAHKSFSEQSIDALVKEIDTIDRCFRHPILERLWFNTRNDVKPLNCTALECFDDLVDIVSRSV